MFMAFMAVLAIVSAPLTGGQLRLLAGLHMRLVWLIVAALVIQILITDYIYGASRGLLVALHLATYVGAAIFLWVNRSLPGLLIIGLGTALNAGVIALNGGTLPASASALVQSGTQEKATDFQNSGVLAHPLLPWLGDIVATPAWLPFRNVMSIGDLIILTGAVVLVHSVSRSRPAIAVANLWPRRSTALTFRRTRSVCCISGSCRPSRQGSCASERSVARRN